MNKCNTCPHSVLCDRAGECLYDRAPPPEPRLSLEQLTAIIENRLMIWSMSPKPGTQAYASWLHGLHLGAQWAHELMTDQTPNQTPHMQDLVYDAIRKLNSRVATLEKHQEHQDINGWSTIQKTKFMGDPLYQPDRHGYCWNDIECRDLLRAHRAGLPIRGIAKRHGRTQNAILLKLESLGVDIWPQRSQLNNKRRYHDPYDRKSYTRNNHGR